jgi:hypothetical protein
MAQVRGAFPYPFAQPQDGGGVITLGGGGLFYFPSGEYIISLPASNMVLEWWNPLATSWVTVTAASDYISADGYNLRLRNTTAIIVGAPISNAGSGGVNGIGFAATGANIAFLAPVTAGGITATGYVIVGGSVQAPTITQAGSGFTVPPLVVIDPPPPGGIQATAVAALTAGGGITSITMSTVGAGYAVSPNFYLIPQSAYYQGGPSGGVAAAPIPPPGLVFPTNAVAGNQNTSPVGAQLTSNALTGSGTVTGLVMINFGTGYTAVTPTATITGVGAAASTLAASVAGVVATAFVQPRVQ